MNGIVVYATCYGSTRQYADWISDALGYEVRDFKDVTDDELAVADIVIIGSWVLAHRLYLDKWIREKRDLLRQKHLFLYSVSGAEPGSDELTAVFEHSVQPDLLETARTYQCGGRRETKKMSGTHKFMMWIATTFIEKDPEKKAEMKQYVDRVSESYIVPMIEDIRVLTHLNKQR